MKIIKEPSKNIVLLWRRPKPVQSDYRPMKYLLKAQIEDGLLIYNVVTSEMILLDDDEARLFGKPSMAYTDKMDELIARHYLVTDTFDESKSVRQLRALIKKLEPAKRVTGFTILPTTECNARCYYCFESNYKRYTMTDKMVVDVVDYIEEKCKGKSIDISWFGGEPLVAHKQISKICAGLNRKKIEYSSTMVSNAYLFDRELIKIAKNDWKLKSVQITLDGTEKVYNEAKSYVNSQDNPFKRVLQNIEMLLDNGIAVNVRLNVTEKNLMDLSDLIELLSSRFSDKRGFTCYAHAVYEKVGYSPLEYDDSVRNAVDAQTVALDEKLMKMGLLGSYALLPSLRFMNCMSDNDACRLIYPDGHIGKCENRSSSENIGDIYQDITDEDMNKQYEESSYIQECEDCCLYPTCINLKICPETGKCTKLKLSWKAERYTILMKDRYIEYQNESRAIKDETVNKTVVECDS